ncbi:MAG TPA: hypothetical protein VE964_07460, partial [Myxococcales bacterium]|nr:hypothetical protein [Myxococcales bacterium]
MSAGSVASTRPRPGVAAWARSYLPAGLAALCGAAAPAAPRAEKPAAPVIRVFDSRGGLGPGWSDLGWSPRQVAAGAPARLDFSRRGGWILANPQLASAPEWLTFRLRAPAGLDEFLEVRLDSLPLPPFPHVRITHDRTRPLADGWIEVRLSFRELNPKKARFDRIIFEAFRDVGNAPVLVDEVALSGGDVSAPPGPSARARVRMTVDCAAAGRPINPLIYGIAGDDPNGQLGVSGRRWGGNPNTRYNWQLGYAWNA